MALAEPVGGRAVNYQLAGGKRLPRFWGRQWHGALAAAAGKFATLGVIPERLEQLGPAKPKPTHRFEGAAV